MAVLVMTPCDRCGVRLYAGSAENLKAAKQEERGIRGARVECSVCFKKTRSEGLGCPVDLPLLGDDHPMNWIEYFPEKPVYHVFSQKENTLKWALVGRPAGWSGNNWPIIQKFVNEHVAIATMLYAQNVDNEKRVVKWEYQVWPLPIALQQGNRNHLNKTYLAAIASKKSLVDWLHRQIGQESLSVDAIKEFLLWQSFELADKLEGLKNPE